MQKKNRKEKFLDCLTDGSTLYIGLNWKRTTAALRLHSGVILQGVTEGKPSSVLNSFSAFCSSFYLNQGCPEKIKRKCLMVYLSCPGFGKCYIGRLRTRSLQRSMRCTSPTEYEDIRVSRGCFWHPWKMSLLRSAGQSDMSYQVSGFKVYWVDHSGKARGTHCVNLYSPSPSLYFWWVPNLSVAKSDADPLKWNHSPGSLASNHITYLLC